MRIRIEHAPIEPDEGQVVSYAGLERAAGAHVTLGKILKRAPHPPHWIEDAHRALHNVGKLAPANGGKLGIRCLMDALAAVEETEGNGSAHYLQRRPHGGSDGLEQGRLAGA